MRAICGAAVCALVIGYAPIANAYVRTTTCVAICNDTCATAGDGFCQDGGAGADSEACALGTDCTDCGYRAEPGGSTSFHCREGELPLPIQWCSPCAGYYIQSGTVSGVEDGEKLVEAIEAAFDAWNAVECSSFHTAYLGRTDENRAGYAPCGDNVNFVGFVNEGWSALHYPSTALAITSVTFDLRTGTIVDADMEINGDHFEFELIEQPSLLSNRHDLQNVVTHEVGHFLGLDHALAENHVGRGPYTDATMAESSPAGDLSMRDLHEDDIAGICAIYPLDRPLAEAACELPEFGFAPAPAAVPGEECSPHNPVPKCDGSPARARARTKGCSATHGHAPWQLVLAFGAALAFLRRSTRQRGARQG